MLVFPVEMVLDPLVVPFQFRLVTLAFRPDHEFDGTVDYFVLAEDPLADILTAVRALFLMNQTLMDAYLTE